MKDKRYRQAGYRDEANERRQAPPAPARGPGVLKSRAVSRCADCGTILPLTVDIAGRCPACGSALHACTQCTHFDPGQRFECAQPVPERVADKRAANPCALYALRTTVERETSSAAVRPDEARRGFDNLFRKS